MNEVTIDRMGDQGDGIADTPSGPLYVPFSLPGERLAVAIAGNRARIEEILAPSPDRIAPVCRHFGNCGGCALQHWRMQPYLEWKRGKIERLLAARRIAAPVEPVVAIGPATRRRTVFAALATRSGLLLGHYARASHEVVTISQCPVLTPTLEAKLAGIQALLKPAIAPRGRARITVTESRAGLDIDVNEVRLPGAPAAIAGLAARGERIGLARLTWSGETLLQLAAPVQEFDGIAVVPPPGAFLQASQGAEAALIRLVRQGVAESRHVVDLFAGCGTFSLPLARFARVTAIDGDGPALSALQAAARAPGLKPVTTMSRDLMREALSAAELKSFDAVVLDPPFAGAKAQAEALAASGVPRVIMVSCNPATFARDARALIDGGFGLAMVTPVDQFAFSPHIELVGVFLRDAV